MTSAYRDEATEALRRERSRAVRLRCCTEYAAKLMADTQKSSPVILDHCTARTIAGLLQRLEKIEKAVQS